MRVSTFTVSVADKDSRTAEEILDILQEGLLYLNSDPDAEVITTGQYIEVSKA